ncbi:hypothetical protein BJ546DRAFT_201521 [Cryomyces antarcticus]
MPPLLLRRLRISPRTFQYACRIPSARFYARPRGQPPPDDVDDDGINWYEQDSLAPGAKRRRLGGNPQVEEANELRRKIRELEDQLGKNRSSRAVDPVMAEVEKEMLNDLSDSERQFIQETARKQKEEEARLTEGVEVDWKLPQADVPTMKRLNASLRAAAIANTDPEKMKSLWRWYSRCKQSVRHLGQMLPDRAWEVLWITQSIESPTNPDRAAHVKALLEDMVAAGRTLAPAQRFAYLEAVFLEGQRDKALELWHKEAKSDIGRTPEYLELGVRMYALSGKLDEAQRRLEVLLDTHRTCDPRIILPVLNAHNERSNFHQAWALYLHLRNRLSSDMSMTDYDTVTLSFLAAGRKDLALAAFRDMMLCGKSATKDPKSKEFQALYQTSLERMGAIQSLSVDASEVNSVSLEALTFLPRPFQNKFFYASWLKKLIGMGELDAASRVVELMYERGVNPDPKHVNGLIGAWLRTGHALYKERAEQMAWSMIQERLDFAWRRRNKKEGGETRTKVSVQQTEDGIPIPKFLQRPLPPATIETFSILALHYLRRGMYEHVTHLKKTLKEAEIPVNSYFMNHVLYAELRRRGPADAWKKFDNYTRNSEPKVAPDLETFACLWECEKRYVDKSKNSVQRGFPTPRFLFGRMVEWHSQLSSKDKARTRDYFTSEMYDQIMDCFCLDRDLAGCLITMHALKSRFGAYPNENIARKLVLLIARLPFVEGDTPKKRRRISADVQHKRNVAKVTQVLEMLVNRRREAAAERGVDLNTLDDLDRAEENLSLFSELVMVVLERSTAQDGRVEDTVQAAASVMGVEGISTGGIGASHSRVY